MYLYNQILIDINTMLCPIKVNSNTIEITVHPSCYCILDLLCVKMLKINLSRSKYTTHVYFKLHYLLVQPIFEMCNNI